MKRWFFIVIVIISLFILFYGQKVYAANYKITARTWLVRLKTDNMIIDTYFHGRASDAQLKLAVHDMNVLYHDIHAYDIIAPVSHKQRLLSKACDESLEAWDALSFGHAELFFADMAQANNDLMTVQRLVDQ